MYNTAVPVMTWHKTNEEFLINRHPIANVGVVWSQQNMDFYGRDATEQLVELPMAWDDPGTYTIKDTFSSGSCRPY